MTPEDWTELLESRAVDTRIVALVVAAATNRTIDPPTTDTKQLLIAHEVDGYAAGRIGKSVLSLFFDPDRARRIGERYELGVGSRSEATWIVRIPADQLDDISRRNLASDLLIEALDRVAIRGPWNRGLPDRMKVRGGLCSIHQVQRSVSGACWMCEE